MANSSIVLTGTDDPRVDSRLIASQLGIAHRSVIANIERYLKHFQGFGLMRFKTEAVKRPGERGTKYEKYALLNEDQTYFLLSLSRNSERVVDLKARLVLADRFAWAHIRPGESMPLTKYGKTKADAIERDIEMIGKVMTRAKYKLKPLETGQYRNVPTYMLSSKRKAAYVGSDIDPSLLAREIEYYRAYFDRHGRHMEGVSI